MVESMFWSVLLRTGQFAIEASTTLLVGLLVAVVMRRMLGAVGTRKWFGGMGWNGLLRAWGVGMLLPVCSLGVIPIAREMRRAGVPSGTILAFVMAAPHINPLSLLYGLTLSEPMIIVCFAAGSLVIALASGAVWERFFATATDDVPPGDEPMPAPGLKRLAAVAVTAARESVNPTMGYILLGLVFTGVVTGLLPHGCLSTSMRHDDPTGAPAADDRHRPAPLHRPAPGDDAPGANVRAWQLGRGGVRPVRTGHRRQRGADRLAVRAVRLAAGNPVVRPGRPRHDRPGLCRRDAAQLCQGGGRPHARLRRVDESVRRLVRRHLGSGPRQVAAEGGGAGAGGPGSGSPLLVSFSACRAWPSSTGRSEEGGDAG